MTTTKPTYAQTLRRIADALEPVQPYWDAQAHGRTDIPEPSAVALDALAEAIASAPPEHLQALHEASPEFEMPALEQWAQGRIERGTYPRFFELLAQMGGLSEEERSTEEGRLLFFELMQCAPPRFMDCACESVAEYLPSATHVNDQGQPVYTLEQVASATGKTPQEIADEVDRLREAGLLNKDYLHTGTVFPLQ